MITVNFNKITIKPGFKILDIGCGPGRHVSALYAHENVTVIGADLSLDDLKQGVKRLQFHDQLGAHCGGTWAFTTADITRLPFKDNEFDLVICSEVMEHIPDEGKAASELLRVLKPGHDLVVSVPRFWPERICWALSDEYFNANQGHIRIYKKNQLMQLIEKAGAKYRTAHHAHSLHSPYWWLKCFIGPTREDSIAVNLYKRFLTWDILSKPALTKTLDRYLNPLMGKSLVLYFKK
ncbi:MAG: class I SAM-dependent methyltransferase [Desulfobacteraceae bacterium]